MTTYSTEQEAMAAAEAESIALAASGSLIEFDGQNCSDAWEEGEGCAGWDGNDRRCDCGNRRVTWSFYECRKGAWAYYAEAW